MLKKQRHEAILEYLKEHRFAKVDVLSELTKASEITIRRDINELDSLNKLKKVYGGAELKSLVSDDIYFEERSITFLEEKNRIARYASTLIEDKMKVYLDAGTSIHCLIPFLEGKDIEVYTHGVNHVEPLSQLKIKTYLIGGEIKPITLAAVGTTTLMYLDMLRFDICFMGTNAIDEDQGMMTPDINEAMVKRKIIERSDQAYILADHSKFDKVSNVAFGDISLPIITDRKPENMKKELEIRVV